MQQRTCGECGAVTEEGEDFCGQCGAYLEWEERTEREVTPAESPPLTAEPPAERGLAERVKAAVGLGPTEKPPDPAGAPTGADVPVAAPTPAAKEAAPVQPAAAVPRPRPMPTAPRREQVEPGALICGECGAGNKPDRKYCRRCGHELSEAVVARAPWWRRIFTRRPRTMAAGTRPTQQRTGRRVPGRLVALVLVLALVVVGGYLGRDYLRGAYEAVLDQVKGVEEVNPARVVASSSRPDHAADLASDSFSNTYWSPVGGGKGATLTFTFDPPMRLVYLSVLPGVTGTDKKLLRTVGRPRRISVLITSDGGTQRTETLELDNAIGQQDERLATSDVVKVRLKIEGIYAGTAPGSGVAIGEVEFRARK